MQTLTSFKKFSSHLKNCLLTGLAEAKILGHQELLPVHLLYGLLQERGSVAGEFLLSLKLDVIKIKALLTTGLPAIATDDNPSPEISEAAQKAIIEAVRIAYLNRHKYVGTEHLLFALLKKPDVLTEKILTATGANREQLAKQAETVIKTTSKLGEILSEFETKESPDEATDYPNSALNFFGRDLTGEVAQKTIDPVIGRELEIQKILEILSRRSKNNPLLIGDPGVGKTAIIEGLAKKIQTGEVPEFLAGKKIFSLDLSAMVAGTSFRGEFEARIKEVVNEAEDRDDAIVFIDEIHQIVGAGSASGSMDAANILKPALARGRLKIIGATTYQDYRKSIENDPALARRFQTVKIDEPSEAETKTILLGLRDYFEDFHKIKISDEAIDAAVNLSQRYINDKLLPDKAIDLIDEASAGLKTRQKPSATELEVKKTATTVKKLNSDLREQIVAENYLAAAELKDEINRLNSWLAKNRQKIQADRQKFKCTIGYDDIARTVARQTGIAIPLQKQQRTLSAKQLAGLLATEVIGQTEALQAIIPSLMRTAAGLGGERQAPASFIFVGPSGVGKTYLAEKLAEHFFGNAKNLIKINMSEYGEKFNASKLIGAPAGYVGYKESGELTEKIKRQPYSLVLLDEIEKANSEIFDLFLRILDDGYLTDATGQRVSFKNSIIVMTSNIGSNLIGKNGGFGFEADGNPASVTSADWQQKVIAETKKAFKPEFINRLDRIVCFNNLSENDLKAVARRELDKLAAQLQKDKQVSLKFDEAILTEIIRLKTLLPANETGGARAIQKIIKEKITTPLAEKLLARKIKNKIWRLTAKNGIITLS
jgi:ATP-dependent Clp protease ATP-binding subunit ClpC